MSAQRHRRRFSFVWDAVFLTAVSLSLFGCPRPPVQSDARVPIDIDVEEDWVYATHPLLPLDAKQIRSLAIKALHATGTLAARDAVTPPPEPADVGRLLVRVEDVKAETEFEVSTRVSLTLPSGRTWQASGRGTGNAADALSASLLEALEEAWWESSAARLSDEELVEALSAAGGARRKVAATRLAARRHPAAFEPLAAALSGACTGEEAAVALGAFAALGDARAVPRIIDALERCDDPTFSLQAVYVLGGLGGFEAEAYLFTLIAGHADPRLRDAAQEAHAMLQRNVPVHAEAGE